RREDAAQLETMTGSKRRRVGQRQSVCAKQNGSNRSDANRDCRRFYVVNKKTKYRNAQSSHDPSRGAEAANPAKVLTGVFHLPECQRIGERHGGHVEERVDQKQGIHRTKMSLR